MNDERRLQGQEMKIQLTEWLAELWELHFPAISQVAETSGDKASVSFDIEVEFQGPQHHLRGTLNFKKVEKYADSRERMFGDPDPDQEKLDLNDGTEMVESPGPTASEFIAGMSEATQEEEPVKRRGRPKKRKEDEPATETAPTE